MKHKISPFMAALLSLAMLPGMTKAQVDQSNLLGQINTITTAVPFLIISPDARAGGMGDVGVSSSPDANAIHWNPSKLAFVDKKMGFSISYTPWLRKLVPDINLAYVSFYNKLKGDQTIGASLRYFSLGNITFTDNTGAELGQFNPAEFAFDIAYARKLSENFSGGIALRYINSNLTGGFQVENNATKAGNSVAADISAYYQTEMEVSKKDAIFAVGVNISNIGTKISYTETGVKDFIPINLRLGPSLTLKLNEYNDLAFMIDFNKLLVPTPPIYNPDSVINGEQQILFGKNPDVSVASGIFNSFSDAPDGGKEELREINIAAGLEYWYDKQFAFRAGYFYEHETKGNRKYFTLGAGLKYNVFGLDFAYLIPTDQRNPLENTLRFSLVFDFDSLKKADDAE
ncbi:MAG: type IX secretion system outer membrane channel protein PorV [Bacteroidetes bacterium]|nr:type IX secretion system outer membrane channel protein PorV [Bacteroidota bacterium]